MIFQRKFYPFRRELVASLVVVFSGILVCAPANLNAADEASSDSATESTGTAGGDSAGAAQPGSGVGNFTRSPLRISVSVREGYDDNVDTTNQNPVSSLFTNGNVVMDYKFGSARTNLNVEAFAGATYYYTRPFGQQYDINSGLSLTGNHQATPRLSLAVTAYVTYQSEPDLNIGFGVNRRSGNYFYTSDKFSLSYLWSPRFSTTTSYTLGVINYEEAAIGDFEDRFEHTIGNEFRYLVWPTTSLIGEYRYQIVDYTSATRNSTTDFVLAGLDHSFSPHFNVTVRGGAQFRQFDTFGERTSPYAEGTLNYSLGPRTSVSWTNRYGLDQPDIPTAPSRTSFQTGLNASYGITTRITATASVFYRHDENEGVFTLFNFMPPFSEDSLDVGVGLRYEINRFFAVIAGLNHTEVLSDISLREYTRNRFYLGLNATF